MENFYYLVYNEKDNHVVNYKAGDDNIGGFLMQEGFKCSAGFWGCPWFFVNVNTKEYKPGRPGIGYGPIIGNHAITLEEFKIIWEIHKKYQNIEHPLEFEKTE